MIDSKESTDLDLTVLSLPDESVPCFWHDCSADATWTAFWTCGCAYHYCDVHAAIFQRESAEGKVFGCKVHAGDFVPFRWERI